MKKKSKNKQADVERKISKAEKALQKKKKQLAALRKRLPKELVEDYSLMDFDGREVKLSSLFGDRDELIVVHNMGRSCSYCTLWADGFNGVVDHLNDRAPFVVVSPDDPATQREFARSRGWKFRMLSAKESTFTRDLGFETDGEPMPGVSAFRKTPKGRIYRVSKAQFGPGDEFCAAWHIFDLLPRGANKWQPKYEYDRR